MKAADDKFLGEWTVHESVFAADGSYIGSVAQRRHLYAASACDELIVKQWCEPDAALHQHPMAHFSGEFIFRLQKKGRLRHYLGPDVQGFGQNFGERFLMGQGVWPRFGYNFRSWSIAVSPEQQLTGGCFFRGGQLIAVILGIGRLQNPGQETPKNPAPWLAADGAGQKAVLTLDDDRELIARSQRRRLDAQHWQEQTGEDVTDFHLEARAADYLLATGTQSCGMAKAYGPMLLWETFDQDGRSTQGLEVNDPFYGHQYSLRQNFVSGRLSCLEAVHWQI